MFTVEKILPPKVTHLIKGGKKCLKRKNNNINFFFSLALFLSNFVFFFISIEFKSLGLEHI
jgi:hypothetical protein